MVIIRENKNKLQESYNHLYLKKGAIWAGTMSPINLDSPPKGYLWISSGLKNIPYLLAKEEECTPKWVWFDPQCLNKKKISPEVNFTRSALEFIGVKFI